MEHCGGMVGLLGLKGYDEIRGTPISDKVLPAQVAAFLEWASRGKAPGKVSVRSLRKPSQRVAAFSFATTLSNAFLAER
jgi:hypothetical protein